MLQPTFSYQEGSTVGYRLETINLLTAVEKSVV